MPGCYLLSLSLDYFSSLTGFALYLWHFETRKYWGFFVIEHAKRLVIWSAFTGLVNKPKSWSVKCRHHWMDSCVTPCLGLNGPIWQRFIFPFPCDQCISCWKNLVENLLIQLLQERSWLLLGEMPLSICVYFGDNANSRLPLCKKVELGLLISPALKIKAFSKIILFSCFKKLQKCSYWLYA